MFPSVSIIVAVKQNNRYLEECVKGCLELEYPFFEIIILPDEMIGIYSDKRITVIPTGVLLPAAKRDIGASHANGQVFAFIDDDTYPHPDWLKQAVLNFNDESVACVGGPAVTPEREPFLCKAGGKVFESIIVSGPMRFRYVPMKKRFTDDFPSCNFLIRREAFQEIGGFNSKFWPGEDTVLCLEVTHKLKKKIIYDPLAIIYHHRRPLFKKHAEQIANYALHRGYFVKRFPKTSLRIGYFLPSGIVCAVLCSIVGALFIDKKLFIIPILYASVVALFSLISDIRLSVYIFIGIIMSHFVYGCNFIRGLISRKLKEEQ